MNTLVREHRDSPNFCRTGLYICTRDWCCIYGMRGNSASPWADIKDWQAWKAMRAASWPKEDGK